MARRKLVAAGSEGGGFDFGTGVDLPLFPVADPGDEEHEVAFARGERDRKYVCSHPCGHVYGGLAPVGIWDGSPRLWASRIGAVDRHAARQEILDRNVPTVYHEMVHALSRYWLASLIHGLPSKRHRREALADIPDEGMRSWVKVVVESMYRTRSGAA